jgi:DNA-binding MarR family transcriptional regulator
MARTKRTKLAADAWGALLQTHAALVPVLDKQLQRSCGLPLSWYDVLLELNAAPEQRLTMTELASRVVLSRTRVSRLADELAVAGLVERSPNPADGRSAFTALTALGRERFLEAAPHYLAAIEEHFAAGLTNAELTTLSAMLAKVR